MEKLVVILVGVLTCQIAMANNQLPFIGERYFNVVGGNGTEQSITIDKLGHTVIALHGKFGSATVYHGDYKVQMCDEYECYKIIGKDKIALTDKQGNIKIDCRADNEPCITPLYK